MTIDFSTLNWLAIGVVCMATFFLGAIWYTVFGPLWVKYNRFTPEQVAAMKTLRPPAIFFGGMLISYALFAIFMALVVQNLMLPTWTAAAVAGVAIWLAIAVPIGVTSWIASDKRFGACAIDLAYQFVYIVGGSIILAMWR